MKTLLLLRHAKSSWEHPELDHDRPLNDRGLKDAPRVGTLLLEKKLVPDLIISSTAKRTKDTADLVIEHCKYKGKLQLYRRLYAASPETIVHIINETPENIKSLMIIGHNPDLEELVQILSDRSVAMPTACLVVMTLNIQQWQELTLQVKATIKSVFKPKDLL